LDDVRCPFPGRLRCGRRWSRGHAGQVGWSWRRRHDR
jgi:hypothetical protein